MVKHRDRKQPAPESAPPARGIPVKVTRWLEIDEGWAYWLQISLLILALLAVVYPGAFFQGRVFQSSDAGNSLMFSRVGDEALARGHYPLWNPYLFAGMPSFGSLAYVRYLYPPSVVFNFLQNALGFVPLTWMFGHLLFGGLGMVWLLRRWNLTRAEVLLGALIWLLFPKVVAWGVHGHGSKLGAAMYLPWIVGWTLRILDGRGLRAVAMTGLLLGVQLLRGHIQIAYYTLGVVAWFTFWGALWPLEPMWRRTAALVRLQRTGQVVVGLGLGFLIAGILLVPVHDYARISVRGQDADGGGGGAGLAYATGWSLAPQELSTFVLPSSAGFGQATYMGRMPFTDYPNYFGFLVLILAGLSWTAAQRRWLVVMGLLAVLVVSVAFGNFGFGLYELLYRWLPFFNKFRVPSMILVLVAFALAVAAPRGVHAWREGGSSGPQWLPVALCGVLGAVLMLAGGASLAHGNFLAHLRSLAALEQKPTAQVLLEAAWQMQRGDLIRIGFYLLLAAGAFGVARARDGFRRRGLAWVLLLLVFADLGRVDARITHPENFLLRIGRGADGQAALMPALSLEQVPLPAGTESGPDAALLQREVGHDRIYPLGTYGGRNAWMADGIRSLGGYHPAKLATYEVIRKRLYGQLPAGRIASWLSAKVVSFDNAFSPDQLQLLAAQGLDLDPVPLTNRSPYIYRNRACLPRARLVDHWLPDSQLPGGGTLEGFLDAVQDSTFVPGSLVYLSGPGGEEPAPQAGVSPAGETEPVFVSDGLNEVSLQVKTSHPAMLVLADMNAPGWRVTVDEKPAELLTADLVLRAVKVGSGTHEVRFVYSDPAVDKGLVLTGCGLVLTLGLLLISVFRRRRANIQEVMRDE